jgi:RHS repeat-associated protein
VLLTWHPLMAPPGVTYNVYRSATAPVPVDDAHRIASGLRLGLYLDRGGAAGLYYVVTAQNAAGESGPSNTARAQPLWLWGAGHRGPGLPLQWPDPLLLLPVPLLLVAVGRSRRRMRWAAPVGAALLGVAAVCLAVAVPGSRGAEVQRSAGAEVQRSAGAEVQRGAGAEEMVTRVITYTYDPLHRLTGAEYSTGERYEYAYDAVGNRTVYTGTTPLAGTAVTTYTYDAANRLLISSSPQRLITYTWDARGNLIGDGTFTYTYNAAGRLVRAQSITATVVYTYTADGLRVGQAVAGAVTTYAWDWAAAVPELLQTCNLQSAICNLYLIGHETLGWWDGVAWAYILPDALGSVRQAADGGGAVVRVREWTPYGEEVGGWQAGLGYTGEWQDTDVGLVYLRARWYAPGVGIFTVPDPFPGVQAEPGSLHPYLYVLANPVNTRDPKGEYPVPLMRPGDVCPAPTEFSVPRRSLMFRRSEYILRRADGSLAFWPGPGVSEWWYCGEFKITAYQFVAEANGGVSVGMRAGEISR